MVSVFNSFGKKTAKALLLSFSFFLVLTLFLFGVGDRLPTTPSTAYASYGDEFSSFTLSNTYTVTNNTYEYSFTVPYNGIYRLKCWGAQGGSIGSGTGGKGGYVWAEGYFTSGTVLNIYLGQQGTSSSGTIGGGGASDDSTSGGGSTDIRYNGTSLSDRIMVAGGGGGGSRSQNITVSMSQNTRPDTVFVNGGNGGGEYQQSNEDYNLNQDYYGYGFDGGAGSAQETKGKSNYSFSGSVGATGGAGATRTSGNALQTGQSSTGGVYSGSVYYLYKGNYIGAGGGGYYGGYAGSASKTVGHNSNGTTNYSYSVGQDSPTQYMDAGCAAGGGGGSSFISGYTRKGNAICDTNAGYTFLLSSTVVADAITVGGAAGGGTNYGNTGNGKAQIEFVRRQDDVLATTTVQRIPITREGWYQIEANALPVSETRGDRVKGYIYLSGGTFLLMKIGGTTGYNNGSITIKAMPFNQQMRTQSQVDSDFSSASTILCAGAGGRSSDSYISGHPEQTVCPSYVFSKSAITTNGAASNVPKVTVTYYSSFTEDVTLVDTRAEFTSTQSFTVTDSGKYAVRAWGAYSGGNNGGMASAYVWLKQDEVINVVVSSGTVNVYIGAVDNANRIMTATAGGSASAPSDRLLDAHVYSQVNTGTAFCMLYLEKTDTTAPTGLSIIFDRVGQNPNYSESGVRGWYYDQVTVSFAANDVDPVSAEEDSGVTKYMYRVTAGSSQEIGEYAESQLVYDNSLEAYVGQITISWNQASGTETFYIELFAVDFVGNGSSSNKVDVTIGFDRNEHTLDYYDGSGSICTEKRVTFNIEDDVIDTEDETKGGFVPVKAGMTFVGWYRFNLTTHILSSEDSRIVAVVPGSYTGSTENVAVYAMYTLDSVAFTAAASTIDNIVYNVGTVTIPSPAHEQGAENIAGFAYTYEWEVRPIGSLDYQTAGSTSENFTYNWGGTSTFLWRSGTYYFRQNISASITLTYMSYGTQPVRTVTNLFTTDGASTSNVITVIVGKKSLAHSDITVSGGNTSKVFTGHEITQANLVVMDKGVSIDVLYYQTEYHNNVNANVGSETKATITITATTENSYYTGVVDNAEQTTFTIDPKDIGAVDMSSYGSVTYTGSKHMPGDGDITLTWTSAGTQIILVNRTDFDFSYGDETHDNIAAGTGVVKATGKGNYTGTKVLYFSIEKAVPLINIANVVTEYTFTGSAQSVDSGAFAYVMDDDVVLTGQTMQYGTNPGDNTFTSVTEGNGRNVTIYALESENYAGASVVVTLTMLRKAPTIDLSLIANSFQYDGTTKTVPRRATANNFVPGSSTTNEAQPSYALDKDGVMAENDLSFVDVPTTFEEVNSEKKYYYVLYVRLAQSTNYLAAEETCKIYVIKAEYVVSLPEDVSEYAVTYDGEDHVISGFASVPNNVQAGAITYSNNTIHDVPASGEQRVYATVAEVRNYYEKTVYIDVPVYPVVPVINDVAVSKTHTYDQGNEIVIESGVTVYYVKEVNNEPTNVFITALVIITYENNVFQYVSDSGYMTVRVRSNTQEGDYNYAEVTKDVYITILKYSPVVPDLELSAVYGERISSAQPTHPQSVTKTEEGYEGADGLYVPDVDDEFDLGTVNNPAHTATATFYPSDGDNNNIIYAVPIVFTLSKATRVLDTSGVGREYTYTGQVVYFTGATIGDEEGTILYSPASFVTVAEMNGETLTITVNATDNYYATADSFTITVNKAYEEIDLSGMATYVYTGESYSVTAGAALYNTEQTGTLIYSANSFTTVAEADGTEVTISAAETANYLPTSVTYTPVMARAPVHFDYSAVTRNFTYQYTWEYDEGSKIYSYTGVAQTVTGTVLCYNAEIRSGENYTHPVEAGEGMVVTFSNNVFVSVPQGNALQVCISVEQTANYAATELTFGITVEKAVPQTRAQTATATYGLPLMNAMGLDPYYTFIDGSVDVGSVASPATGLYVRFTPRMENAEDLLIVDTVPLTLTVEKGSSGLSVSRVQTQYTYTGFLQTVESGATINNTEQTIVYSNNTFTTVAEGNGKEVVVSVSESANYLSAQATVTIIVNKADPVLDVSGIPTEYVYNRQLQTVTGATIDNEEQTIEYSSNTFTTVAEGNALRVVRVSVASSANYKQAMVEVPFTVLRATQEIDTSVAEEGFVYTGEEQTVTASIADPEQTLSYTANKFTTVAEGNGMRISITAAETPNYNAVNKLITITVRKRVPTTTAQSVTAYYGQILNDVKSGLDRGYSFEELLITPVGTPSEPLEVTVKYDSGNENEEIVLGVACTIEVSPRPVTIRPNDVRTMYGDEGFAAMSLSYSVTENSIVEGDDLHVTLSTSGLLAVPGEYAIYAEASNDLYDVSYEEGVYTIEKRKVYITPDVAWSYYGEEPSDLSYTITGGSMYGSDELSGSLSISVELLAGGYEIENNVTHDYYEVILTNDVYTVQKRPITVYAETATSVYGEETDFAYVVECREGYDLTGSAMVGTDVLAGRLYLERKDVGRQVILSELHNANYDVEYISAYCLVTPAALTITAVRQTSAYGEGVFFTYEVTDGTLLEGDDPGAVLTQTQKNVGEYDIQGEFTNENYVVTFVSAKHVITPRPITVKLVDASRTRLTYMADPAMDNNKYLVTQGSIMEGDDLQLVVVKESGNAIGDYELTATSENPNYDVTVRKGVFTITKDPSTITVDKNSLITVYDGKEHEVKATVSSGADPIFFYKGEQTKDVCVAVGQYLIRITAEENDLFYAPEPVEVTLIINKAELKDESSGVTVLSSSEGFAPDEKLVVTSDDTSWDEEEFGELPESYGVTESYSLKKLNGKNEESMLSGEITVKVKLSNRFAAGDVVSLALVCGDETIITEAVVEEDGTVVISGTDISRVAVIEQQNKPSVAILLILAGAAVLLLFVFVMVKAGLSRK